MRAILLLIPIAAWAQIEQPRVGWMLDGNSMLRPVRGIPASATLGEPVIGGVGGFACSAANCFTKIENSVVASDQDSGGSLDRAEAPDGAAVIAPDVNGAFFYLPKTGQTARWNPQRRTVVDAKPRTRVRDSRRNSKLEFFDFQPAGEVLAIRSTGSAGESGFDYAVRRDDGVWIEHYSTNDRGVALLGLVNAEKDSDGESEDAPRIQAVLLLEDGSVFSTDSGIAIVRSDGSRRDLAVPGVVALYSMSSEYVEAVTGNGNWAVCITAGSESANLLPGAAQ